MSRTDPEIYHLFICILEVFNIAQVFAHYASVHITIDALFNS